MGVDEDDVHAVRGNHGRYECECELSAKSLKSQCGENCDGTLTARMDRELKRTHVSVYMTACTMML